MPDSGLRRMIAPLGSRLVARERRVTHSTGVVLARSIAERRKPRALEAATRLAIGRTMSQPRAPEPAPAAQPDAQLPEYFSPFAASVLFGNETLADQEAYDRYEARVNANAAALAAGDVPRGRVEEGPAATEARQFRLARAPRPAPPEDAVQWPKSASAEKPRALSRSAAAPSAAPEDAAQPAPEAPPVEEPAAASATAAPGAPAPQAPAPAESPALEPSAAEPVEIQDVTPPPADQRRDTRGLQQAHVYREPLPLRFTLPPLSVRAR